MMRNGVNVIATRFPRDFHWRGLLIFGSCGKVGPKWVVRFVWTGHEVYDFRHPRPGNTGFHWSEIAVDWQPWSGLMPRVLSRPVSRRVGEKLVATMTENGLVLRRPHGRRRVLVTWKELDSEYLHDDRRGVEAFTRPLPARWLPAPGEWIWAKPASRVWSAQVRRVLNGLGEEIVVCRLAGRVESECHLLLSQTRPKASRELKRVVTPNGKI